MGVEPSIREPLLSVEAVAVWLGVSRPTVYKLYNDGALSAVRVGTRLRFDPVQVRAYLSRDGDGDGASA